jgi:hypothetical protein
MGDRKGGLRLDPAVEQWRKQGASNPASLTKKQRQDRKRTRAYYDVPAWLKSAVEQIAEEQETSASQAAMMLLSFAAKRYVERDADLIDAFWRHHEPSRTLQFVWNLNVPNAVENAIVEWCEQKEKESEI